MKTNKPKRILYISKEIQKATYEINKKLYVPRNALGPHCRRAGWKGFDYKIHLIPKQYIIKLK